jgi:hypothetical protein
MSGYLYRMVSSVRNAGSGIHPIVGSIYSAPGGEGSLENLVTEEGVISTILPEPRREFAFSDEPRSQSDGWSRAVVDKPELARTTGMVETGESGPASPQWVSSPTDAPKADGRVESSSLARSEIVPSKLRSEIVPSKLTYTPLVTGGFSRLITAGETVAPPKTAGVDLRHGAATPSRASDEIQIHIGRIEVTAIHPAPVRTAPAKPARCGPSLDEYLRRRNGGSS